MADVKRQDFNPDNVMMHEMKDGTLLNDFNEPIMLEVLQNSKVMQLGRVQDMGGKSEKLSLIGQINRALTGLVKVVKFKLLNQQ